MGLLVFLIIAAIVFAVIIGYFKAAKCPKCGKRRSSEIDRWQTRVEHITIHKEEKINHYRQDQMIGTSIKPGEKFSPASTTVRKYTVPGERVYYDVKYRCNYCNNEYIRSEYQEYEK